MLPSLISGDHVFHFWRENPPLPSLPLDSSFMSAPTFPLFPQGKVGIRRKKAGVHFIFM
jgi:hypothetical protein